MSDDGFQLMRSQRKELLRLFRELEAPSMKEMNGEFRATLLDQGRWIQNLFAVFVFNLNGIWVSKSFAPLDEMNGHGYNSFRNGNKTKRIYRMKTSLRASNLDDQPSFHLDYQSVSKQERLPALTKLRAEVRKLTSATYLGIGTADFGIRRLQREQPFLLEGPVAEFDTTVWEGKNESRGFVPSIRSESQIQNAARVGAGV